MKESVAADALHVAWETEGTVTGRSAEKTRGGGLGVALVSCRGPGRCGGRRHPPVRGAAVQVRPQTERASPRDRRRLRQRGRVPGAAGIHPGRHSTTHRRRRSGRPERARVGDGVRTRHHRRAATGHLVRRMMEHGVDPRPWVDARDLPSNITIFGLDEQAGSRPGPLGRARRLIRRWLRGAGRP